MKFKHFGLVAMMVAICLICSCGGGSGSDSESAQKAVALSFAVNTDGAALRSITVVNPTVDGLTYQYKATALFANEFAPQQGKPQGDTNTHWADFASINSNTGVGSVGDFAQGRWEFEVRVIKKANNYSEADTSTFTLMYQTSAAFQTYINATTTAAPIEVTVVRQIDAAGNAKGTLIVNGVTAPSASGADKLVITYGAIGQNQTSLATINSAAVNNGLSTFTNNNIPVTPGIYVMTFTVKDSSDNAVGASTKTVEIVKGLETTISGSIDAGKWVTTNFTVKGIKEITCTASVTATTFVKGVNNTITITFTGYISENGEATTDNVKYYFCDGFNAPVLINTYAGSTSTEHTYDWVIYDDSDPQNIVDVDSGYYYPCIIASDAAGTLITNDTNSLKVTIQ